MTLRHGILDAFPRLRHVALKRDRFKYLEELLTYIQREERGSVPLSVY